MIPFNIPLLTGNEKKYIEDVFINKKMSGDGIFTKKCNQWFEEKFNIPKALLTTSCTHAIEISSLLTNIKAGDEIIMPSFTFVSTANAFVLRGAKIVFVDIRPDTMNIDENKIEEAITPNTKAIVPVHYAGVSCEMDKIMDIAKKYNLYVIEDAAQGMMATYKEKPLGTIGDIGCYSFHETKNYQCGEGGLLLVNNNEYVEIAEIIREKGTDRSKFLRGQVDKYTWVSVGSSYLPSEINAAFLYAQLENAVQVNNKRLKLWNLYYKLLEELEEKEIIELPKIPESCKHNAHMFYIKLSNNEKRQSLINHLKSKDIQSVFHYVPLHSAPAGKEYSRFHGKDVYTTTESERLLRLPMFHSLEEENVVFIVDKIKENLLVNNVLR